MKALLLVGLPLGLATAGFIMLGIGAVELLAEQGVSVGALLNSWRI